MKLFVSKAFCGYARPPGWSESQMLEENDDDASHQPGLMPFAVDFFGHIRNVRLIDICQPVVESGLLRLDLIRTNVNFL